MGYNPTRFLTVLVALALISAPTEANISCTQALEYLMPCQPFLMGYAPITSTCCLGANQLVQATASPTDRKSVCQCLKQAALSINVNQNNAKQLPQLCKVDVPVAIQPDVNCDEISLDEPYMADRNSSHRSPPKSNVVLD